MRAAAATLTPVVLELGGKDPFVVADDVGTAERERIAQVGGGRGAIDVLSSPRRCRSAAGCRRQSSLGFARSFLSFRVCHLFHLLHFFGRVVCRRIGSWPRSFAHETTRNETASPFVLRAAARCVASRAARCLFAVRRGETTRRWCADRVPRRVPEHGPELRGARALPRLRTGL